MIRQRVLGPLAALLAALPLAATAGDQPLEDRARILKALKTARELDPDRGLAHVSHTCDLLMSGRRYPVVDVRELVQGASTPRGVNRILVLSPALVPLWRIPYTQHRPLLCRDNRLFLYESLRLDDLPPEGNVLVFTEAGQRVQVEYQNVNDWPIYPPSRE